MEQRFSCIAPGGGNTETAGKGASRASSLDVMKCLAAFCVVMIHYGWVYLSPFVRIAVPIFFLISGYYYPSIVERRRFFHHLRKLLVMVLCASALYGIWTVQHELRHDTLELWFAENFQLRHLIGLLVFDNDMFGFHLWYFYALIYDLIIFYLADRWRLTPYFKYLVPLTLLVFCIFNFTPWYGRMRNFLFFGLPCMMIGRWIREGKDSTYSFLGKKERRWQFVLVSMLLCWVEFFTIRTLGLGNGAREMYIFTLPLILPLFYFAVTHPNFGKDSILAAIGQRYSAYIYIFHVLVAVIFMHFVSCDTIPLKTLRPFIIFFGSLLLSVAYVWTKTKIARGMGRK